MRRCREGGPRSRLSALLALWGAALGCSTGEPRGIDGAPGFAPYPDMDGAVARAIAGPPRSTQSGLAGMVDVAPDGTIRVARSGTLADPFSMTVERYSSDGLLEDSRALGSDVSVIFHPGGDVTLARWSRDGATSYTRWSPSFSELARTRVVRGGAAVDPPDYYRIAGDGTFTVEPGRRLVESTSLLELADRDGGFYGVQYFTAEGAPGGARLLRLDADHAMVGATWLFPGAEMPIAWQGEPIEIDGKIVVPSVRYSFGIPQLLVGHDRRLWVVSSAPALASRALSQFTGYPVAVGDPADTSELLVMRYSPDLALEAVIALPAPSPQLRPMIAEAADGTIGVAALSLAPRPPEPDKTTSYNTWFASIDHDGRLIGIHELDLGDDDLPYALSACRPGFCIAGELGTRFVDSRSQVEFARGYVLALGTDGHQVDMVTLHGPRRNAIDSLAARGDGSVVFSGSTDGPITHTDPSEWNATALLGVVDGECLR